MVDEFKLTNHDDVVDNSENLPTPPEEEDYDDEEEDDDDDDEDEDDYEGDE